MASSPSPSLSVRKHSKVLCYGDLSVAGLPTAGVSVSASSHPPPHSGGWTSPLSPLSCHHQPCLLRSVSLSLSLASYDSSAPLAANEDPSAGLELGAEFTDHYNYHLLN